MLPYVIIIVMIFYPVSGFIADVCCGQLKIVVVSLYYYNQDSSLHCYQARNCGTNNYVGVFVVNFCCRPGRIPG